MTKKLEDFLLPDEYCFNEKMSKHTTFKVGGEADLFIKPKSYTKIKYIIDYCTSLKIDYFILGNGSNLLVSDKGYRGCIISMDNIKTIEEIGSCLDKRYVKAGAGVLMSDLSKYAHKNSYSGFEFACGIPGSIGGGIFMNAGAYEGEIKDVIYGVYVYDLNRGIRFINKDDIKFLYRNTNIKDNNWIVLAGLFCFTLGDKQSIGEKIDSLTIKREEKQPLEYPSAGSTFKRPIGYYAGKLIIDAGLSGKTIGGAQVSTKHAGFIINKDNASAKDIYTLIQLVQDEVFEKFGIKLEREVRLLGEF